MTLLTAIVEFLKNQPSRPSWDEYFMAIAHLVAMRSPCDRLHVGCAIVSPEKLGNRIIALGYNGFLPGVPHTPHMRDDHEIASVHAEQNAIGDAARRGVSVEGATAYVTHYPCIHCAKAFLSAGIVGVKYFDDYRNDPLVKQLFTMCQVPLIKLPSE
ncbi:MAG: dCMP deaminase family protein [Puniceicoccales bacterium]|jgi:dCMP deaminase|nr:dCMP deaminase family protein [Puniceicoccales bacterium]